MHLLMLFSLKWFSSMLRFNSPVMPSHCLVYFLLCYNATELFYFIHLGASKDFQRKSLFLQDLADEQRTVLARKAIF